MGDTISTWTDPATGAFKLTAFPVATYEVKIVPSDILCADSTVADISVLGGQVTGSGAVRLPLYVGAFSLLHVPERWLLSSRRSLCHSHCLSGN